LKALLPAAFVSYLKPMTSTVFMLSCGALVREAESFKDLANAMRR